MKLLFLFSMLALVFTGQLSAQKNVRVMSYNIHNGVGMDQRADYRRVAEAIRKLSPDLVALQEVDSVTQRSAGADILHELSDYTLMHRTYAPAIPYQGGKYGIGLLSKEKPLRWHTLPLPGREEQRVLLVAEFKDYVFFCTHFSLTEEDQLASVALIVREAERMGGKPVLLAGDLNAHPDSPVMKALLQKFKPLTNVKNKTFPSVKPEETLDYILIYTGNECAYATTGSWVIDEQQASDHRPVLADLRLATPVEGIFRTTPYLQNPIGGGITVSWLTHAPVYSWVEYGTDTTQLQRAHTLMNGQVVCNNTIHKIRLNDLKPGVRYYYRVCSREILSYQAYSKAFGYTAVSPFFTFQLPEPGATDFTALVFNDIHNQYKTMAALYDQVKDCGYDFVVFNGDCFDAPGNEAAVVNPLIYYNGVVGADHIPVFYLRGNHEIRSAYSLRLPEFMDYVGGKTYSAFNWGDTRFVLLDCGEDKPDDHWVYYKLNDFTQLRNDQAAFLKEELKSKAFRKANKRVLIHHIPVYGNTDEYQPCTELWGDLLKNAPFNVSLNAHTHEYVFHPKGSAGNHFPVFVGGGYTMDGATVMVLTKRGDHLTIKVVNTAGEVLKEMEL